MPISFVDPYHGIQVNLELNLPEHDANGVPHRAPYTFGYQRTGTARSASFHLDLGRRLPGTCQNHQALEPPPGAGGFGTGHSPSLDQTHARTGDMSARSGCAAATQVNVYRVEHHGVTA